MRLSPECPTELLMGVQRGQVAAESRGASLRDEQPVGALPRGVPWSVWGLQGPSGHSVETD